ncbi:creatininase family protein [Candidatus Bathyarchaeota archaeon]|nr:creatininase family protein [Candidatus Bathyarchaeota archaeon]
MVQLAEISWSEANELLKKLDIAILPVGSTEQHGPHNPLGTDHLVAEALSKAVGDRTGVPVLPIIPVGISEHHRQFPGTLWVPHSVFRDYVKSVILSITTHGPRKILIINGHGGNEAALIEIAGELRREHNVFVAVLMAFPPTMVGEKSGHAGYGETSINLYFHKHLVKMERAVDTLQNEKLGPFTIKRLGSIGPAQFPWDTIDLSDSGVLGPAGELIVSTTASEDTGRALMEPFIEEVCKFVETLKKATLEDLLCKPHK